MRYIKRTSKIILTAVATVLIAVCGIAAQAQVYRVGDLYTAPDGSRGIVYWLNPDGSGGWVVALNDDAAGCPWGTEDDITALDNQNPGNNRQQLLNDTAGYAHTAAIRAVQGAGNIAAGAVDFDHGWYLPAPAQLSILYGQLPFIETALVAAGGTTLTTDNYWCSAEVDAGIAWSVRGSSGYFYSAGKTGNARVRAVRSFTYATTDEVTYVWSDGSTGSSVTVLPTGTATWSVTATSGSCEASDTVTVTRCATVVPSLFDGLVAYYPFDDDDLTDHTGNGNDGNNYGSTSTTDRFCREGKARNFAGVDSPQYIDVPNSSSLQFTDAATVSLWFCMNGKRGMDGWGYPAETGNNHYLFAKLWDSNKNMRTRVSVLNNGEFILASEITQSCAEDTLHGLQLGQWMQATIVYTTTYIETYVNGQLIARTDASNSFSSTNNQPLRFGMMGGNWYPMNGKLDDIRIFNRALNANEVEQLYLMDIVPQDSLLVYLPLNGDVTDYSGNGFQPVLHGNVTPTAGHLYLGDDSTAYHFPGMADSWIEIPHDDRLNLCGSFTVSAWYNRWAGWTYGNLVSKGRDIQYGWKLGTSGTNVNGSSGNDAIASSTPADGYWHLATSVYDASTSTLRYYLDGELEAEATGCGIPHATNYPVAIGRHRSYADDSSDPWPYPFKGDIDDIVIYNRPLSAEEVHAMYAYNPHAVGCVPVDTDCHQIYLVSDDFNDGVIDTAKWTQNGNAVFEEDGLLKMQQNVTDQYVHFRSVNMTIPASGKVALDRKYILHRANTHYGGYTYFYFNGSSDIDRNNFVGIDYSYASNTGWYGNYLVYKLNGATEETRVRLCDVNFDIWQTEHIEVDFSAGTLSYYMDTLVATVSIPGLSEQTVDYYNIEFRPYGWGTGHQHYMDWVDIYGDLGLVSTTPVSGIGETSATCGGTVSSDDCIAFTTRGVCWSTSHFPTLADAHTSDGSGTGEFTSSITGLDPNTTYYVRAYATNSMGTVYGGEVSFTTLAIPPGDALPCPGHETVTDHEGNVYNTVKIGEQCWTKENMRCTTSPRGHLTAGGSNNSLTTPYYFEYVSTPIPLLERGYLYNWAGTMDTTTEINGSFMGRRGICPEGWHVPSNQEVTDLINYLGSVPAYQCGGSSENVAKALVSTNYWSTDVGDCSVGNNPGQNNATGFSAVPAGYFYNSQFFYEREYGSFWSSTSSNGSNAYWYSPHFDMAYIIRGSIYKEIGRSVRCLLGSIDEPSVSTAAVTDVTSSTAICGGIVTADGGSEINTRGVCWSTSPNPTLNDNYTNDGTGTGAFTSNITGLTPCTTYYVRAFARNYAGTRYGEEFSFTTEPITTTFDTVVCSSELPLTWNGYTFFSEGIHTFTLQNANGCDSTVTLIVRMPSYALSDDFNDGVIDPARWSYTGNAVMEEEGLLKLQQNVTDQDVHIRSVDMNIPANGKVNMDRRFWVHKDDNMSGNFPAGRYYYARNAFLLNGDVNSFVGVEYNYREHYDNAYHHDNPRFGTYLFSKLDGVETWIKLCDISFDTWMTEHIEVDFTEGTLSYYRDTLMATVTVPGLAGRNVSYFNADFHPYGWWTGHQHYMDWVDIYGDLGLVSTALVSDIGDTSATCGGSVSSDDCIAFTTRGFCWSTSHFPTLADAHTSDESGTGAFTSTLTGLTPGTTYYVRAYATNSMGTSYGDEVSFTTLHADIPDTITIGNGVSADHLFPFNNYYKNSWNQMIYPASQINETGNITSVSFYVDAVPTSNYPFSTLSIYMGISEDSVNATNNSWLPMSELSEVYSTTDFASPIDTGWQTFNLSTPFPYDGSGHLVIVTSKTMPNYTNALRYRYTTGAANCCIYRRSDSSPEIYASHPGSATGTLSDRLPNLRFTIEVSGDFCYGVTGLAVNDISKTGAAISWSPSNSANVGYIMQYKTTDQNWDDATTIIVYDTTYDLAGMLTSSSIYNIRIATNCGENNSAWKSTSFATLCDTIASLPYMEGFDTYGEGSFPLCWTKQTNYSNSSNYPYVSSSQHSDGVASLYFYKPSSNYMYAASQALDLANYNAGDLALSFYLRPSGLSNARIDVGIMSDPEDPATFTLLKSYYPIDFTANNQWHSFSIPLTQYYANPIHIAFYAPPSYSNTTLYVDEVKVDFAPVCSAPSNLTVSDIAGSSAIVSWNASQYGDGTYTVEYSDDGTVWSSLTTSETNVMLTGLTPTTTYQVRVYQNCNTNQSDTLTDSFTTHCLAGGDLAIGNGAGTSSYFPEYSCYNYSYTQQIFLASEMNGVSTLHSAAFEATSVISPSRKISIYLMHTTQSNPTSYLATDSAVMVYNATATITTGWNTFNFTVPFQYNGTDNLALIVVDSTGYYNCSNSWSVHTATTTSLYSYTDSAPYSVNPAPSGGSTSSYRNNVIFGGLCDSLLTCFVPNAHISGYDNQSIEVTWAPGNTEEAWELEYRAEDETEWTSVANPSSPMLISNLTSDVSYDIRLRAVCSDYDFSDWVDLHGKTECDYITSLPYTEDFENATGESPMVPCWTRGTNSSTQYPYTSFSQHHSGNYSLYFYGSSSNYAYAATPRFDDSIPMDSLEIHFHALKTSSSNYFVEVGIMTDPDNPNTFTLLNTFSPSQTNTFELGEVSTNDYSGNGHYVAFRCPQWVTNEIYLDDVVINYISNCTHVSNIHPISLDSISATIGWTPGGTEVSWNVYIVEGTTLVNVDTLTPAFVSDSTFQATNLLPNTIYTAYVQANCGYSQSYPVSGTFATSQIPAQIPYFCDFEDESEQFSFENGIAASKWYIGTAVNNGGSHALYVSQDNGASNTYNNSSSQVWAFRDIYFPASNNDYMLSFDWRCNGESHYDYMMVYIGNPVQIEPNSSAQPAGSIGLTTNTNSSYPYYFNLRDSYQHYFTTLSGMGTGTVKRLYFYWRNDQSGCYNPAASVDNILIAPICNNYTESVTVCDSYTWMDGNTYTTSGTYEYFTTDTNGCANKYTLLLTVNPSTFTQEYLSLCENELPYLWNGQSLTESGTYTTVLQNANGCDSTLTLTLNVLPSPTLTHAADTAITPGDSVTLWASGAGTLVWMNAEGDTLGIGETLTVTPTETTTYFVTGSSPNLVFNGDFEQGNTGFTTSYNFYNYGNCGNYYIGHENHEMWSWDTGDTLFDHTTGNGIWMMVDAVSNYNIWTQTVNVTPNTDYVFSAWFLTDNIAEVKFEINDVSGSVFTTPQQRGVWERQQFLWNSGTDTTAVLKITSGYASCGGNDFGIDDIVFAEHLCEATESITVSVNSIPPGDAFSCPGHETVTDYDGNVYNTVKIGEQCWMKENLRTTHYEDGTEILAGSEGSFDVAYRYCPNNDSSTVPNFGYLYNWAAVMHGSQSSDANPSVVQGVCPAGWHVPSHDEWYQLEHYVSSHLQYGYVCHYDWGNYLTFNRALASTVGWTTSDDSCSMGCAPYLNNATGFDARPAGYYFDESPLYDNAISSYSETGLEALFWSSTEINPIISAQIKAITNNSFSQPIGMTSTSGLSVRCVLGDVPVVTTFEVSDITNISATGGGTVTYNDNTVVNSRGVCWSTSHNPTVEGAHTVDGTGNGSFNSAITGLQQGTLYYVRAYATSNSGTVYGEETSFTTRTVMEGDAQPCPGVPTVTDYDGNVYATVKIGEQCWMKENLRTTHYEDGVEILAGSAPSLDMPYRYCPNGDSSNVPTYGYLYNWTAVMHGMAPSDENPSGIQGICPSGWHMPSDAEWTQLTNYVSSVPDYVCGDDSTFIARALAAEEGWHIYEINCCVGGHNPYANNITGFSALPAGDFDKFGSTTCFWSVSEYSPTEAWHRAIGNYYAYVFRSYPDKDYPLSVRCVLGDGCLTSVTEFSDTTCFGSYTWNDTVYTESGDYTQALTSAAGCDSIVTLHLTIYSAPSAPAVTSSSTAVCLGSQVTFTATGDANTASYIWYANGVEVPGENLATLTVLFNEANNYLYAAKAVSNAGCVSEEATSAPEVTVSPSYTVEVIGNADICEGGSSTLSATVNNVLAGDVLNYQWYKVTNGTPSAIYGANAPTCTISDLSAGYYYYYVVVSGTSGCSAISSYIPVIIASPSAASIYDTVCDSYEWNGVTYTESGTYTQTFTNVAGCDSTVTLHLTVYPSYQVSESASICQGDSYDFFGQTLTTAGTYSHTLETVFGCDSVITLTLTVVAPPTLTLSANHLTMCAGGTTTLTASVNASSQLPNNFSYEWIIDGGTPVTGVTNTYNLTLNTAGSHTVQARVTQGNTFGCTSALSSAVTVHVAEQPVVSMYITSGATICSGGTTTMNATVTNYSNTVNGVTNSDIYGGLSFSWTSNGSTMSYHTNVYNAQDQLVQTLLTPGNYTYQVSVNASGYNCQPQYSNTATVTVAPAYTATISGNGNVCEGGTVTLNATVGNVLPNDALGYQWYRVTSGSPSVITGATSSTHETSNLLLAGSYDYYVVVTSSIPGCGVTSPSVPANVVSDPIVTLQGDNSVCIGNDLLLNAFVSGGVPGSEYTYTWEWSGSLVGQYVSTAPLFNYMASPSGSPLYFNVTISRDDNTGCNATSAALTVNVASPPSVTITASNSHVCQNDTVTFTANVSTVGTYNYIWTINGVQQAVNSPNISISTSVVGTISASVEVSDANVSQCSTIATIETPVEVVAIPTVSISGSSSIDYGQSVSLTAYGANSYSWSTGNNTHIITASPTSTTTYTVTGTSQYGCTATASKTVTVNPVVPTVITNNVYNISTYSAIGSGNVTSHGGATVTARGVCWSTSHNPSLSNSHSNNSGGTGSFNSSIAGLQPNTTYYVRAYATNSAGTAYGNEVSFTTTCNTITSSFYASDCGSYTWNGQTYTSSGDYSQTFTAANGCDSVVTMHLTIHPIPSVTISGPPSINYGQSATLSANGANSYIWNTGETSVYITISPTANTTYTVTGTNQYGCTATASKAVTVIPVAPTVITNNVSNVGTNTATCGGNVTSSGGTYVSARGVCWSTFPNPTLTLSDNYTINGGGTGLFTSNINGLSPNTTYYVRAYAINNVDTAYGQLVSFTTECITSSYQFSIVECDSYVWNGYTYTQSGDYTQIFTNAIGCDSTVTLHLTILSSDSVSVEVTECSRYEWNGVTYTESGDYTQTFTNADGCDSVVTLHLTIEHCTDVILVYPNPTSDHLHILFPDAALFEDEQYIYLFLYDPAGHLVFKQRIDSQESDLPLPILNNGLYLLEINVNGNTMQTFKQVIIR